MNTQRAVMWVGFLGLSAALAWAPGHWFGLEEEEAGPIVGQARSLAASTNVEAGLPRDEAVRPSRDLFPSQQWTPPQALATVTEQPVLTAPVTVAPTAPTLPFRFIGRMGERDDLQIFLQSGDKLYVVRQGDVIDDTYRLDHVSATELGLVYLPLHQPQTLSVGSAP
ncbi:hypothetical protein [Pseudomonas mosselii]|uniref:hypothetical protein n=1 Tax=Pseudomonas mosselii TaxID=78327 RepID=UPI00077063BC|nr:hypothetical protein [Pseudomonas mosselii]AMK31299.1 putative secretion system X translation initiation factor [Pseudomonas putida]MBC3451429.1 hypothetical protein [Pseudomonas mosselii]MEA3237699.1 hypothetical protein [Pseudomonas mosselii]MEB5934606.1 hypothetical protein [Pseudomonas mosselii]UWS69586.1 hypothetical protein N0U38_12670 [Pseudomonas mosselii]